MNRTMFASVAVAVALFSSTVLAGDFDGTWKGKWDGESSAKISVKNDKVTSYYFEGKPQAVGGTKVKGKKLVFGSDYRITLSLTGKDTAHASYRQGSGSAEADMVR